MEVSNITGASTTGDAVFSLLAVMQDPAAYQAKLNALNAATDANLATINLVGPATEIVQMRAAADKTVSDANATLAAAKIQADAIINDATAQASVITSVALDAANALQAKANAMMTDALTQQAQARLDTQSAADLTARLAASQAALDGKIADAEAALTAAQAAKVAADTERQDIIAKHEQFIAGL